MRKSVWIMAATSCLNVAFAATVPTTMPPSSETKPGTAVQTTTTTTTTSTKPLPASVLIQPTSGNTRVSIPSFTMVSSKGANVAASGIDWMHEYDIKSSLLNHIALTLSIKNIKITNVVLPIDGSFNMAININNMNLEAIAKIMARLNAMNDAKDNKQMQAQIMQEVNDLLPQIVTNTSNATMREVLTTQQGDLIKDLKFNYPSSAPLPTTTQELLRNMQLTLYIKIPIQLFNTFLNQATIAMQNAAQKKAAASGNPADVSSMQNMMTSMVNQFLDDAVKKGYIIKTQTDYLFNLNYEGGVLRVNGKTMDEFAPSKSSLKPTPMTSPTPSP